MAGKEVVVRHSRLRARFWVAAWREGWSRVERLVALFCRSVLYCAPLGNLRAAVGRGVRPGSCTKVRLGVREGNWSEG